VTAIDREMTVLTRYLKQRTAAKSLPARCCWPCH